MFNLSSYIFSILFFATSLSFAAEKAGSSQPTYLVSGSAQLLSHFVDRGLSVSDKNPALNASFLFNLGPQFRFGFWGSNISNVTSPDDNLWLKIVADVKIEISSNAKLFFYINDDHFYKSNLRNGQEVGFNLDWSNYFYQVEFMNNFQGSRTNAEYYKGGKKFNLFSNTTGSLGVGYTMQHADGYSNYLDVKATANYLITEFFNFELGATTTFGATGLNGRGTSFVYLGVKLVY